MESEVSLHELLNNPEPENRKCQGKQSLTPQEKFLTEFPSDWEEKFENFDNKVIEIVQYFHIKNQSPSITNKVFGYIFMIFSFLMTYITQIENGPSVCIFLFIIGLDHIGRWFLVTGAITALVAQFPKRFCFRKRPYMRDRALRLSKDKTSSFPSRAVVCSVVYAYAIVYAINYYHTVTLNEPEPPIGLMAEFLIILLSFLSASFARVHLGVHYPSDCVVGMILGLLICVLSNMVFALPNIFGCPSCYADQCYPIEANKQMDASDFSPQNFGLGVVFFLLLILLLVGSNLPPLKFWDKSAAVFGSFGACIIAEIMMVCPKGDSKGLILTNLNSVSGFNIILAFILSESNLLLSVFSTKFYRKKKQVTLKGLLTWNILIYLVFTIFTTIFIIKLRLSILFS